jgi:hypothetical protein
MSDTNDDQKKGDQRPLGAVLGWLNLSPTSSNNQDNMTGATAGLFEMSFYMNYLIHFSITTKIY